jgi:phosphoserine aminotransferase
VILSVVREPRIITAAYWVEPGRLLAGLYPGEALEPLLAAGIRSFVSLLEPDEVAHRGRGVRAYEPRLEALARERGVAIRLARFPIEDCSVPARDSLVDEALDWIDAELAAERPVYVHCWGGRGRTGLLVACWLIRQGRASAESYLEVLAGLRAGIASPSPDTAEQANWVATWARGRAARAASPSSAAMGDRIFNFSAGPAVLPEPVLAEAREAIWNLDRSGIGVLEHSHRGKVIDRVFDETEADCRKLAAIPDDYALLYVQGGASSQFFMLPANYLADGATADYLETGAWSEKAIEEARRYGKVHVACSSRDANFSYIPAARDTRYSERPAYVHFTSNNTIFGTQFAEEPTPPAGAWLACDASSDLFSRPFDARRYGLIYAGAQKNFGPAGLTLLILRRDLLDESVRDLPTMLRYKTHAKDGSRYNTPPVFAVYVMGRVMKWLLAQGGLEAMAARNREKAAVLYDAIDASGGFYRGTARRDGRSLMNVTFRLPDEKLEAKVIEEAERAGLSGLKGHRSVGGLRASIYNAFPKAGCVALAELLREFQRRNG